MRDVGSGEAPDVRRVPPVPGERTIWRTVALAGLATILLSPAAAAQELPGGLELSGGVYLYHFQPLGLEGAEANSEIYALFLNLDRSADRWTIHVQGRWRDTKLRSFFPSTTWLQEAWGSYAAPVGEASTVTIRAGKIYQRIGRFWDGSFFGNLHYFDGLKLDPEFGIETVLETSPGDGGAEAEAYLQGLVDSDRTNGALAGRDLEGGDELRETALAAGIRVSAPVARPAGRELRLEAGLSGLAERTEVSGRSEVSALMEHVAADLEARWGPVLTYLEWTRRASGPTGLEDLPTPARTPELGPAGSRATWWLAGLRVEAGPFEFRYNASTARYGDGGFREWIHQPGLTLGMAEGAELLVEYDDWRREPSGSPSADLDEEEISRETRLDRSLNLVLLLTF